jgi:hypothetical protein
LRIEVGSHNRRYGNALSSLCNVVITLQIFFLSTDFGAARQPVAACKEGHFRQGGNLLHRREFYLGDTAEEVIGDVESAKLELHHYASILKGLPSKSKTRRSAGVGDEAGGGKSRKKQYRFNPAQTTILIVRVVSQFRNGHRQEMGEVDEGREIHELLDERGHCETEEPLQPEEWKEICRNPLG